MKPQRRTQSVTFGHCAGLSPVACHSVSIDPLADKYPSMSAYMYTAGNPVMVVDPEGMRIWVTGDEGEQIEYKPGMKYEGTNKGIIGKVNTLNQMNETKNGNKLLTTLSDSKNIINISSGDNGKKDYATFCGDNGDNGDNGGTGGTCR